MIRRLKKDVLTQLPPKRRQKIPFEVKDSTLKREVDRINRELGAELQKLHLSMSDVFKRNPETSESGNLFKVKNLMSKMYRETSKVKIGPVRDYVKMLCENRGLKFLIFAYHHNMMDGIAEELLDSKIKYIRIDGQTPSNERPALVHQFQQDEDTRVAILSIKAAGVGLTLTAAKVVIFAELDWTPGSLQQCEDRAHRIGQKETVHIHYLVAKATLDDYVWSMLTRKTTVITTTLNGVTQTLQVEEGDRAQIDKLSNADVYIPPQKSEDVSFSQIFNSSQSNGQKSLLEYFSPHGSASAGPSKKGPNKRTKGKMPDTLKVDIDDEVVIIDEESPNKSNKRKKTSKEIELSLIDNEGNTSDEFGSPPVKMMRLAPKSEEDNFSELLVSRSNRVNDSLLNTEPRRKCQTQRKWGCSTCTFLNHESLPYCEMCSSAKPQIANTDECKAIPIRLSEISQDISLSSHVCEDNFKKSKDENVTCEDQKSESRIKVKNKPRTYIRARKSVNPHQMSDSDGEATDDNAMEGKNIVQTQENKIMKEAASSEATVKHTERKDSVKECAKRAMKSGERSPMDDSIDTVESNEFFSEDFRSNSRNKSKDPLLISEFSDADDANTEAEINRDQTLIMDCGDRSPTKKISGKNETPKCTPGRPVISYDQGLNGTPPQSEAEIINQESMVAMRLFSPKFRKTSKCVYRESWTCTECNTANDEHTDDCNGCLAERPECPASDKRWSSDQLQSSKSRKCKECNWENIGPELEKCEMCCTLLCRVKDDKVPVDRNCSKSGVMKEESQDLATPVEEESRSVNIDELPVYQQFQYLCSLNTDRIYLYDEYSEPLHVNFLPTDVLMDCYGELPDVLLHPENLKLAKRFVREWNSLTATKRRIIVKSGAIFSNPVLQYNGISSKKKPSKERYTSQLTGALSAMNKANEIGGSVRVLTRPIHQMMNCKSNEKRKSISADTTNEEAPSSSAKDYRKILNTVKGVAQTVDKHGNPLCIHCQNTYDTQLISEKTLNEHPWYTRFCCKKCMDEYWMRHNRNYSKQQVFEAERGVCQSCNFNCQVFFERMRITKDLEKRANLIQETQYKTLKAEIKKKMVTNPKIGQFWQADHIIPVAHGGGECDIDNLRTLCTVCHLKVTAEQHKNKAAVKRLEAAAFHMDIASFFQPSG